MVQCQGDRNSTATITAWGTARGSPVDAQETEPQAELSYASPAALTGNGTAYEQSSSTDRPPFRRVGVAITHTFRHTF